MGPSSTSGPSSRAVPGITGSPGSPGTGSDAPRGSRVVVGGLKIDRVTAARLQDELEHRRGVQVVELDGFTDPAAHQDLRAPLPPVVLDRLAVGRRVLHAGDVLDAFAMEVQELLVNAGAADRLDELEPEPVDRGLGADHAVLDPLAADHGVVQQRRLVVEHAPRAPAEALGIGAQRRLHVGDDDSDLRDRHGDRWRHDPAAAAACHPYLPRAICRGPLPRWLQIWPEFGSISPVAVRLDGETALWCDQAGGLW